MIGQHWHIPRSRSIAHRELHTVDAINSVYTTGGPTLSTASRDLQMLPGPLFCCMQYTCVLLVLSCATMCYLQVLRAEDAEWLPFKGTQQMLSRGSVNVDVHSKCVTRGQGLPSRKHPGYFEIATVRLDMWVQVTAPSGWKRRFISTQVSHPSQGFFS
jgi:hypothetical protein